MTKIEQLKKEIENHRTKSAWSKGVKAYALELVEELETIPSCRAELLNGAKDWKEYSWGGCSLIYNCDICERLCTESEKKRKKGGILKPNSREDWLDVQARALFQACGLILSISKSL